jgi:4-amino-4-deoxy-L-arabinose transferase-like glycosyltransferase
VIRRIAGLLVTAFILVAGSAMLRTSTTFDEIVFPAVGVRALHTGDFAMVNDHPRLPQVVLGLPLYLAGVKLPPEEGWRWGWYTRYQYSEYLYWAAGNSGDTVTLLSRLVGLAFGALTVLATFLLARRHMPPGAALFAAALVALMPDVLAHSGVAYNDVPLAFGILVCVYALDAMVRNPTAKHGAVAGLAVAFTICMKYSGLIVLPMLAVLVAIEAMTTRRRDAAWRQALWRATAGFAGVVYAAMVVLYAGDARLSEYIAGLGELSQSTLTGGRTAFLLGERRAGGWWYFFPVAFALKTPLGFHLLAITAVVAGVAASRDGAWRRWASHGARAPAVGALLLLAAVMTARMNIGMRHALPLLPLVCILVAQGVAGFVAQWGTKARAWAGACAVAMGASTMIHYPWFLSYLSEYAWGRPVHETLVDSNTDWGQGLVALRSYMRANGIDRVALAYFGTALPQGYGIAYAPMPSFFALSDDVPPGPPPRFLVVSATLLAGSYLRNDPYAAWRRVEPVAVVGGSLYVFDLMGQKNR